MLNKPYNYGPYNKFNDVEQWVRISEGCPHNCPFCYEPKEYKIFMDWGHSVYTDALKLAFEAGVKILGLFHINQERTDKGMDNIVKTCKKIIAAKAHDTKCFAVKCDMKFEI